MSAESAADVYISGLLRPYVEQWVIEPITNAAGEPDGWRATRRDGAGPPMTIVRDTSRFLANKLAEETRAQWTREEAARDLGGA